MMQTCRNLVLSFPCIIACALSGCATGPGSSSLNEPASISVRYLTGSLHGGQQPIAGSTIKLYAVGQTGYGSAYPYATGDSLMGNTLAKTNQNGQFELIGSFTCPSATTLVYLVATGGSPIAGAPANPNIALMAPLGPCSSLTEQSYISVNEVTTVASIWALAPFMAADGTIGTSPGNLVGLLNAFSTVNKLVDTKTGKASGPALPADALLPVAEINTLADLLASCINSGGGSAGDSSACGSLFALTPAADGSSPVNTVGAALNLARNPSRNVSALNALTPPNPPFQPTLTAAPGDWTIAIKHKVNGSLAGPGGIAADQQGHLWIANATAKNVVEVDTNGAVLSGASGYASGTLGVATVSIDQSGNAWVPGTSGNLLRIGNSVVSTFSGGGLSTTSSIAVDRQGVVWAVGTNSTVSAFSTAGAALSPSGGFGGGVASPTESIAINTK